MSRITNPARTQQLPDGPVGGRPYLPQEVASMNRGGGPLTDWNSVGTRIDTVLRVGLSDRPQGKPTDYKDGTPMHRAAKFNVSALTILDSFARGMKIVLDDPDLTASGKTRKAFDVGKEHLKRVDDLVKMDWFMPALKRAAVQSKERVQDAIKLPARDDIAAMLMEREIRDRLYAKEPTARSLAWQQIIEERDPIGISAVLHAPTFDRLLPERVVEEGLQMVADAADPEAASAREEAVLALHHVELMLADVRTMIANASGIDLSPRREGLSAADREREAAANREGVVA